MHIPDGFLNIGTVTVTFVVSAGGIANAVRVANKKIGEKHIPLMGILAAFFFAAQMLNFPVFGGTSGHLLGSVLAAILVGPWAAVLIMTSVLFAQSLIFQDGGLLALGANIFNMGIIAAFSGYYIYRLGILFGGNGRRSQLVSSFTGAWTGVVFSSVAAALELAFSGTSPIQIVLPAMAGIHMLIGIGEGLITAAVLSLVLVTRADLLQIQRI